ncbi:MAG: hydrogenase-1 expression HyaE [Pseudomonadota bacterium]
MGASILDRLIDDGDAERVDASSVDAYLDAQPETATALFFTGDPAKKLETADLAVILREIARGRRGSLRLAVVDRKDEAALMKAYGVSTLPSAVFMAGRRRLDVIPKVKDWAVYERKIPEIVADAQKGAQAAAETGVAHG